MGAGSHEVQWDGTDSSGRELAPGVYFVRIQTSAGSGTARLIKR
jgi:flagellar hook assembly protein FlgD